MLCAALFSPTLRAQTSQVITGFAPVSPVSFGAAPATLIASGGDSGNPIVFATTSANTICTVSGNQVTFVGVGSCDLTANQAGDGTYSAAPEVTQSITINAASQTITFGPNPGPRPFVFGGGYSVSATGGASGNPIVFKSLTPSACVNIFNNFTIDTAGTCTVAANQSGNANYAAAPQVTQDIVINKLDQTITFGANPGPLTYFPGTFSVSATSTYTGSTTGPIVFTSLTIGVCTISGTTVSIAFAGTCTIAANIAGNANINPAPQVTQNIIINGFPQSIAFGPAPSVTVGGTGTVSTIGGLSNIPVTFTSLTPAVCSIVGNTVTGIAVGTCIIAGNEAGGGLYAPAPQATQSFTVAPVVALSAVVSRKRHLGVDRDVVIDSVPTISGNISTEPRAIGTGHTIVFQFSGVVSQPGFAGAVDSGMFDIGTANPSVNPLATNEVIVTLTGIPDNKRVTVSLASVNGSVNASASIGFLVGDINSTRSVNSSDISGVKAHAGQAVDASNFKFDVNATGAINSSDISAVKARSGLTLP